MKKVFAAAFAAASIMASAASAATMVLDFEFGAAGEVVTGLTVGDVTLTSSNDPLVLFNTDCSGASCTGGDSDLATGGSFGPAQGLVLILDENASSSTALGSILSNPDDDRRGGSFIFKFARAVTIDTITLLDIDSNPTIDSVFFGFVFEDSSTENGLSAASVASELLTPGFANDNSLLKFTLDRQEVTQFTVDFRGSGAIAEVSYSVVPLPAGAWLMLAGLGALGVASRRRKKAA